MVLITVAVPSAAAADLTPAQQREVLAEAQQAYDRGIEILRSDPSHAKERFRAAAERFQLLVDSGIANGRLYFNLGNAYLQAGDLGPAILSYRRADLLIPGDARLRANLDYARSLGRSRITPSGERALSEALLSWHHRTPRGIRFTVFLIAYPAVWLGLIAGRFLPGAWWRYLVGACAVVGAVSGASVAADTIWPADADAGVLVTDDVVVRKGNGEGFEPRFEEPLYQGVEFELLQQRPGWWHILLPDGSSGWIRSEQGALVTS